ncbi:hypothetical protein LTR56_027032 [Elasticomyces elasticus]|nr:hypothetical protein LTR56_027032 [Elasticomyces elasticus]KAK3616817.1 hypothetical protein LTR22_026945 [Elasticomyces elasticus]KAK4926775.1 hypothetical protein LTR49_006457 [Elasticomyces elasticus]KAK5734626.1 hypothetical protein LTS12_026666 [Elasticomyces elasticus]
MDSSPLARLPRELRDTIYEQVLRHEKPLRLSRMEKGWWNWNGDIVNSLGILRVCKQLYAEAALSLYSTNNFDLCKNWWEEASEFSGFLAEVGTTNARALRHITLSISVCVGSMLNPTIRWNIDWVALEKLKGGMLHPKCEVRFRAFAHSFVTIDAIISDPTSTWAAVESVVRGRLEVAQDPGTEMYLKDALNQIVAARIEHIGV